MAGLRTTFNAVGDEYVLNGEKCWITNATFASFYVVFASVDPTKTDRTALSIGADKLNRAPAIAAAPDARHVQTPPR